MKQFDFVEKSINKFLFSILFICFFSFNIYSQNITITDDEGYSPHSSAMLDVKSTTKGLLIPRVTTAERNLIATPSVGLLVFDTNESVFYYYDGSNWINLSKGQVWTVNSDYVVLSDPNGKVGIGTFTPNSKLEVVADASFGANDTLFVVKDYAGNPVFAVFPDGAKVYVDESVKGSVGGFAISGRSPTKATETDYLRVTADSTRIYVTEPLVKGSVGGFAISGRSPTKGITKEYMVVNADSTRIYIEEPLKGSVGGFAISGRSPTKGTTDNYMEVTRDSTRIYVTENLTKGSVGGFAISGRSPTKGLANDYFNVSGNVAAEIINNESRIMWYPQKAAFLAGEVHVGSADSVGTNSTAIGYRTISKGDFSQAMGYKSFSGGHYSQAMGNSAMATGLNSTAIGNYAVASAESAFALGDSAIARGIGSYAFGTTGLDTTLGTPTTVQTVANGDHSFAFGFGSYAHTVGGVAIGTDAASIGEFSMAFGLSDTAYANYSYAIGSNSVATGDYSFAIGAANKAKKNGSYAIGNLCVADGLTSFAIGYQDTASAVNSFAMGFQNHASMGSAYAIGYQNISSGLGSFALGFNNNATGDGSFAIGNVNDAIGSSAFAMGVNTTASGNFATSFGNSTTASAGSSTAFGYLSVAEGLRAIAGGFGTNASGDNSIAFGAGTIAGGEASTAFGNLTQATNTYATSFGASTVASGHTSTAMGNTITVSGSNSFGIGLNATPYTVTQSSTFSIMGGKVGINTESPDFALDVAGYANIAKGVIGTGAIVFRVDGDEALWYNGSVFSWGAGATSHNYFQDNVSIGVSTGTYTLSAAGTANLLVGSTTGTALRVNGVETISNVDTRFNWGNGAGYNYFSKEVGIGTTETEAGILNLAGSAPVVRIKINATSGQLIRFASSGGNKGNISVSGDVISYNAFTGSHYAKIKGNPEKGLLVSLSGSNSYLEDDVNSEIIYGATVSSQPNSKNIIGAFLGKLEPENKDSYDLVMAVGNGVMWIIDNGENLEIGDYLISSSVDGHAMKDKGEFEVSNIVARVAEPVDWSNETGIINGVKHKLVSVFFESFTINNSNVELENKIEALEKANQDLIKRLELIEHKLSK